MKFLKWKKKQKTVMYNAYNLPIIRPRNIKKKKKVHKIQRPSIFTDAETAEIRMNQIGKTINNSINTFGKALDIKKKSDV